MSLKFSEKQYIIPEIKLRSFFSEGEEDHLIKMINSLNQASFKINNLPTDIQKKYRENIIQNMMKEKKLAKIIGELKKHNIFSTFPIKGIYLLQTIYKNTPGIRGMGDIDLIMSKKDYHDAIKIFKNIKTENIYSQKPIIFHHLRTYEYKISFEKDLIEFHHNLSLIEFCPIIWDEIGKEKRIEIELYGEKIWLPSIEEEFLLSLYHSFLHKMPYHHLAELLVMFKNSEKEKINSLAERWGMVHLLNLFLFMAYTVFENSGFSSSDFEIKPFFKHIKKSNNKIFPFELSSLRWKIFFYRKSFFRWFFQQSATYFLRKLLDLINL